MSSNNGNFVRAAEDVKVTLQNVYQQDNATDKAQAQAILALAYAMKDIAEAISDLGSATRYASR